MLFAPILNTKQERHADYLAKRPADELLAALKNLTGEWNSMIRVELDRRGVAVA